MDPDQSPTKRPNELLNVERSPFPYVNDKSEEEPGSTIRPSQEPGIKGFVW